MQMRAELLFFAAASADEQRRKPAADLDDQPRLKMANHAVSDQRVCTVKEAVIEMKMTRLPSRLGWKLLIFVSEFWKMLPQKIELHGFVHIDSNELARPLPQRFRQVLGIGNGLIEVHWGDMEAMPLPKRENLVEVSRCADNEA